MRFGLSKTRFILIFIFCALSLGVAQQSSPQCQQTGTVLGTVLEVVVDVPFICGRDPKKQYNARHWKSLYRRSTP